MRRPTRARVAKSRIRKVNLRAGGLAALLGGRRPHVRGRLVVMLPAVNLSRKEEVEVLGVAYLFRFLIPALNMGGDDGQGQIPPVNFITQPRTLINTRSSAQ